MKTQIFLFAFLGCAQGRNNTTSNVGNAIGNETLMELIEKLKGEVRNNFLFLEDSTEITQAVFITAPIP